MDNNLPIGFMFSIALNEKALRYFANLDDTTKNEICNYIQGSNTGEEAKERINISISGLENSNLEFLN